MRCLSNKGSDTKCMIEVDYTYLIPRIAALPKVVLSIN